VIGKDQNILTLFVIVIGNLNQILNRGVPYLGLGNIKLQDRALIDTFLKLNLVHGNGEKTAAGVILAGGDPSILINPLEHIPAKHIPILIHILR